MLSGVKIGVKICDADLSVMYSDVEIPTTSMSHRISVRHLGAEICDAETCYLSARTHGADPQGPKMSLSLSGGQI